MQNQLKRAFARLVCRFRGHQLYFVRTAPHGERIFHCERCKDRFALCEQRHWCRADTLSSARHGH